MTGWSRSVAVGMAALLSAFCHANGRTDERASNTSRPPEVVATDSGTLRIGTSVPSAEIIIDSVVIGTGRLSIDLPAGSHMLVVRAAG